MTEGTAKKSPLRRPQLIQNCRRTKSDVNLAESQGTVPYLEGLINFEKRRKEFEIIAKIRLFQSACRAYKIPMDMAFCSWFCFLPALDENQCFVRSLEVELPTNQADSSKLFRTSQMSKINTLSRLISSMNVDENPNVSGQISNDSGIVTEDLWCDGATKPFAEKTLMTACSPFGIVSSRSFTAPLTPSSTVFWKGGSEFSPNTAFSNRRSTSGCWERKHQPNDVSVGTSLNSYGNMSKTPVNIDMIPSSQTLKRSSRETPETSSGSCISANSLQQTVPFHLARIALDDSMKNDTGTANYKCVKIENCDRMAELIERTLEKHLISGDHSEYCLVQLLPDGYEFCLPEKCNPYYAVAPDPTSTMLNFVLRRKSDAERMAMSGSIAPSAKKLNKIKRCNLLRWSSGYL
ncbi:unnamed protein product [Onchocerca ochengi]|uniref:Ras-associating domain-containing protein n=1 Tax=Onchocerca ochengi TaxID=42157 RepID=A0A182EM97_ONCOC|nr:unnamed protein product [Onchocerca ochengi]